MTKLFGNGLETFVPNKILKTEDLRSASPEQLLCPPSVEERPLLMAVPEQTFIFFEALKIFMAVF